MVPVAPFLFPVTIPNRTFTIRADIDTQASRKLIGELTTQASKFHAISVTNRCVMTGETAGIEG